jgi:hypothetical protein
MGRRINPLSQHQIDLRARRLANPQHGWRSQVLLTLAMAMLRAQGWIEASHEGGPEPAAPFPALPDAPGSRVRCAAQTLDLSTEEGWREARELLAQAAPPEQSPLRLKAVEMAQKLAPRLTNELSRDFYKAASVWIGELLAAGPQASCTVLGRGPQDLWAVPAQPLGLPGGAFQLEDPALLEAVAESAACWWAARQLYRSAIDARPDGLGRCGLERPHYLRTLLVDLGVLEPDGERVGSLERLTEGAPVSRMATGLPVRLAATAMMRPDKWATDEVGAVYRHKHESSADNRASYEMRLIEKSEAEQVPDEVLFFGLDQCQSILRTRGLDAAALHGIFTCYLAMLPNPTATIDLDGLELLKEMGMEPISGTPGYSRDDLLKRLGHAATVLMSLVFSSKGSQRDRTGWVTTGMGPLWNLSIRTDGYRQQMQLDGLGLNTSVQDAVIDGMTITVSGGPWVKSHLNRGALQGGDGRYQYGPVALSVLQLGRYRQELAFRIGMHLSLSFRVWPRAWRNGSDTRKVESILREVLPDAQVDRALEHRQSGHELREQWKAALATLHRCCGFRFEFPAGKYPPALVPDCLRTPEQQALADEGRMPKGATDKLLQSWVVIHWPEDVQALRQGAALKAVEEQPKNTLPPAMRRSSLLPPAKEIPPNAIKLKKLLAWAKAEGLYKNMRELAPILQISQGQISKLQNGHTELTDRELVRIEKLLGVRVHQRGDGYLRLV